jgi:hypothetical protein
MPTPLPSEAIKRGPLSGPSSRATAAESGSQFLDSRPSGLDPAALDLAPELRESCGGAPELGVEGQPWHYPECWWCAGWNCAVDECIEMDETGKPPTPCPVCRAGTRPPVSEEEFAEEELQELFASPEWARLGFAS